MSASIVKSLYVGILKTRFDLYDRVKLCLKTGEVVEGTIAGFCGYVIIQLETEDGWKKINIADIDDYIS